MKFSFVNGEGEDKTTELNDFASFIGLEAIAHDRYSALLLLQLFGSYKSRVLNPAKVIHEIKALEGIGTSSNTKPPQQFKHAPLKGLWHKHYLADGLKTMAINLRNGLEKDGIPWFEKRVRDAQKSGEDHYLTEEDIKQIADDAVCGNWIRRANANELTGEWIVYAQYDDVNYYLCLGEHNAGDHKLRAQIEAVCYPEFPFLTTLMSIS